MSDTPDDIRIECADALEFLRALPDSSVDLVATDPPYYKVKDEPWDRAWDSADKFLEWVGVLLAEFRRVLKYNGSLYMFASPQLATRIELAVGERFRVLNRIVWRKSGDGKDSGIWCRTSKDDIRSYFPQTEHIVFAEQYEAEAGAKDATQYHLACDGLRGDVFAPLREYITDEWTRAGLKPDDANAACGTKSMAARHYFAKSQWALPTEPHYNALRKYANERSVGAYFRREYEDLRREYEDLRRPFNATPDAPYTDVWDFRTVQARPGKHPCEKPLELMRHIVEMSSKPGAVVCDPFSGSGTTAYAAAVTGRRFVGCDLSPEWVARALDRCAYIQPVLFGEGAQ